MAVGRGSILRAAEVAIGIDTEKQTVEQSIAVEMQTICEVKCKVTTSLKEELPIYLL